MAEILRCGKRRSLNNYCSLIISLFEFVFFKFHFFFIIGVKNVSIYEFSRPNFTTQSVRKHRKPFPLVLMLPFTFFHPHFVIRIVPSFFHSHFIIRIFPSAKQKIGIFLSAIRHPPSAIRRHPVGITDTRFQNSV